jgi:hypothetical protein
MARPYSVDLRERVLRAAGQMNARAGPGHRRPRLSIPTICALLSVEHFQRPRAADIQTARRQ